MDLSILIVNWKSKDYLRKCLESIPEKIINVQFEIIVIDSASYDGCEQMLRTEYPAVRFLQSKENLGFSKSNNLAFKLSKGRALLFLNPDTEIVASSIEVLYWALWTLPNTGAVGGVLWNSDGTIQTSCVQAFPTILNQTLNVEIFRRWHPRCRLWGMDALFDQGKEPREVDVVSGACLMMRREVFEAVGRFSSDYFMYAEDVDLCYKSKQSGYTNYLIRRAAVIHHGGGSSIEGQSHAFNLIMIESVNLFVRKSYGAAYGGCHRAALTGAALLRVLLLLCGFPFLAAGLGRTRWTGSYKKWLTIFKWGISVAYRPEELGKYKSCV